MPVFHGSQYQHFRMDIVNWKNNAIKSEVGMRNFFLGPQSQLRNWK